MQTKKIFFSFLIFMSSAMSMTSQTRDSWENERDKAKAMVTSEKLRSEITFYCDTICQGRTTGSEGSEIAAGHIGRCFERSGMSMFGDSWFKRFHISPGLQGNNVIGMLPGSKSIPCDRYVIVGAHYDHIGIIGGKLYPGADSNASGTAAMTALAEMFGAMRKMGRIFECNIIFVAFDAKEYGFRGSEQLWDLIEYERLIDPITGQRITKDKICLMMNIDQIGSSLAPVRKDRQDYIIMLGTPSLPKDKRTLLENCNTRHDLGLDVSLDYYGSANFTKMFYRLSDQKVFVDNKIPAVLFTSGITMNTNKTWDTPETLDIEILRKRIYLMFHWLEGIMNH